MTLLDILLALPLCYLIFVGWRKGLVREVASLAGVLLGVWAAIHLSKQVAPLLGLDGESAALVAFIVTFLASLVVAYLLGRVVEGLMKAVHLSVANRLAGALLGAAEALVILAVLLDFVVMIDSKEMIIKPEVKQRSVLYRPVATTGGKLTAQLKDFIATHSNDWKEAMQ